MEGRLVGRVVKLAAHGPNVRHWWGVVGGAALK